MAPGVVFESGFILRDGLVLRLLLVMRKETANALFVPSRREPALSAYLVCRLRRLNAASGFPLSSYDVTTNGPSIRVLDVDHPEDPFDDRVGTWVQDPTRANEWMKVHHLTGRDPSKPMGESWVWAASQAH
jgi:hypothetical protein